MSQSDSMFQPIRSELSVPGGDLRKIQKALASDADAIFLDLEDSVAPGQKEAARQVVIDALTTLDWSRLPRRCGSTLSGHRGVIAIWSGSSSRPERTREGRRAQGAVGRRHHFIDRLLTQVEQHVGRSEPIQIEAQIEDATGLLAIREIAAASDRIRELTFGQGDFAASVGMPATISASVMSGTTWSMATAGCSPGRRSCSAHAPPGSGH